MTPPRPPERLGAVALDFARRDDPLAVLLAVALLVILAFWPEPTAGDVPIVARVISFTPSTPRSAPDNRMGDALTGRTLADAAGAAQGRDRGADSRDGIPPAECREWALGCGRYPALATVGASPSPSAALAAAPGTSGELNGGTPPSVRASANTDPQPRAPSKTASSPSAAMQPVRSSGEPDRGQSPSPAAPVTGNSSAIPKGSIRGVGSWMPERFGADYLALPEGAGVRVKLCGAARCVVMASNDAGPLLAMQRKGRIVDLSAALFKAITGLPLSRGIAWVTVRRIE